MRTFKTTLPSRIKYLMYLYLFQEKAKRKGGEGENNPQNPKKHPTSNKYLKKRAHWLSYFYPSPSTIKSAF